MSEYSYHFLVRDADNYTADGIIENGFKISSIDTYRQVKEALVKKFGLREPVVIESLTCLDFKIEDTNKKEKK